MLDLLFLVRNTHFVVTTKSDAGRLLVRIFNANLTTYKTDYNPKTRRIIRSLDRMFYCSSGKNRTHYNIALLSTFINRMLKQGISEDNVEISYDKKYHGSKLKARIRDGYTDRAYQIPYINSAIDTNPMVLIDLKTGKGKTYISMRVAIKLRYTTGIVILARYIEKWISDLKELTTVKEDSIYVVQGKDSLIKLLSGNKKYDFVIFSLSTISSYIKNYDLGNYVGMVAPEDIFKKLGLSMLLNDEVHLSFHAVYMATIRLNPIKVVALSATLDSLDLSLSNMYRTLYPDKIRTSNLVRFNPYVTVVAINYGIVNPQRAKIIGTRGYSQILFEQWLLRSGMFRKGYIKMLLYYVYLGYYDRRKPGEKLLILVQTINMATLLTNYLQQVFKDLKINRYVEMDDYSNVIESDICVSTNQSSGTAIDIPKLITVLQTVSIRSLQMNIQSMGRLREMPGREVRYYYVYSSNLNPQYKLHLVRRDLLYDLAKKYLYTEYETKLVA